MQPSKCNCLLIIAIFIFSQSYGQSKDFDRKRLALNDIALINEVWYENDQQYIHPSFTYAGTGFLIKSDQGVLAATAKHVLLIANPNGMKGVSPNAHLERWIMHPKNNAADTVVIGQLLNTDTTEVLAFDNASVQLRDWIVFKTEYHSPNLKTLEPRFDPLNAGETIYFTGCPYQEESTIHQKATVLCVKGNRIVFSKENQDANIGGFSGSPLIDVNGKLVGILSGTSVSPIDGKNALYGISTRYLQKILSGAEDLNAPIPRIADVLNQMILEKGFESAIEHYLGLHQQDNFYFKYHVSPEGLNSVADSLLHQDKVTESIVILELSVEENPFFSNTHTLMGKAYLTNGKFELARKSIDEALRLWPENEEAIQIREVINSEKN